MTDIPRRCRRDLMTTAELAITVAMQAVEEAGCSTALTDAVVLLGQARDRVADHVDCVRTNDTTLQSVADLQVELRSERERRARATRYDYDDGWTIVLQCRWRYTKDEFWKVRNELHDHGANLTVDGQIKTDVDEGELPDTLFDFPSLEAAEAALDAWRKRQP